MRRRVRAIQVPVGCCRSRVGHVRLGRELVPLPWARWSRDQQREGISRHVDGEGLQVENTTAGPGTFLGLRLGDHVFVTSALDSGRVRMVYDINAETGEDH